MLGKDELEGRVYPPQAARMMVMGRSGVRAVSAHCVRGTILLLTAAAVPIAGSPSSSMSWARWVASVVWGLELMMTCMSFLEFFGALGEIRRKRMRRDGAGPCRAFALCRRGLSPKGWKAENGRWRITNAYGSMVCIRSLEYDLSPPSAAVASTKSGHPFVFAGCKGSDFFYVGKSPRGFPMDFFHPKRIKHNLCIFRLAHFRRISGVLRALEKAGYDMGKTTLSSKKCGFCAELSSKKCGFCAKLSSKKCGSCAKLSSKKCNFALGVPTKARQKPFRIRDL